MTQTTKEQNLSNKLQCSYCGSILPSHALYCGTCGERVHESVSKVRVPWLWPVIIILSAVAAGLVTFVITDTALRPVIVMWFLFVCPGMILVRFFRLNQPVVEWTLALALSFAFDAVVAGILLYAGRWSSTGILSIVIAFSIGGALVQLATSYATILPAPKQLPIAHSWKPGALLPLLLATLFIGLTLIASIWSPPYRKQSLTVSALRYATPTQSNAGPMVAATRTPPSTVDTVIVMDNVGQISNYDPRGDRYAATQLFVDLMPAGYRLGIVRITSSPTPVTILDLQNVRNSSDKELIKSKLSENFFGPVDPNPTAYFTPALQTAGEMLHLAPETDRKYILVVTDALALSGDQNACPTSLEAFHNWLCMVDALEQQGIFVVLLGFTKPGLATGLLPAEHHIEADGGKVLQITEGVNLVQYLTQPYNALLASIPSASSRKS